MNFYFYHLRCRACVILIAFVAMISCNAGEETPSPGNKATMASGVYAIKWTHGGARASVNRGDVIAVFSTASDTEKSYPYTIQANTTKTANNFARSYHNSFSESYRLSKSTLKSFHSSNQANSDAGQTRAVQLGDTKTFWTIDLSDFSTFPDIPSVQFKAVLKANGTYCDMYVDKNSILITNEDAEKIAIQFDKVAYPVVTGHFGNLPVINGSSRVTIQLPLVFNEGMEEDVNNNIYGSYGMGLMWMSYLYDRSGLQAIRDMATHSLLGLDATAAVTDIPKQHLFAEWVQANILSGTTNNEIFTYKTIDVNGNGGGKYFDALKGFEALPQHLIPYTETERQVYSYGVEYFASDSQGTVIIKGNDIQAFIIRKNN